MRNSEITAKILCTREHAFKILEGRGFFFKEKFLQIDYYYTHLRLTPNTEYEQLMKNSFLLRDTDWKRRYGDVQSSCLMYKNKKFNAQGDTIWEEKIKCDISDTTAANEVLVSANLNNWCIKSINGYVFKKGEKEILIQEVDDLGLFIEIEEFENQTGSNEQKVRELMTFAKQLGLPLGNDFNVKISYLLFLKEMRNKVTVSFPSSAQHVMNMPVKVETRGGR